MIKYDDEVRSVPNKKKPSFSFLATFFILSLISCAFPQEIVVDENVTDELNVTRNYPKYRSNENKFANS